MGRPGGSRDDLPTLRVTNISEDTQENDLRDLFGAFGRVARVYVGRDRETGAGKGFAFVSFEEKSVAQKAMDKMHGRGYDNLILSVQWSRELPSFLCCVSILTKYPQRTERAALGCHSHSSPSAHRSLRVVPVVYVYAWLSTADFLSKEAPPILRKTAQNMTRAILC